MTLPELTVGAAVFALLMGSLMVGVMSLQRSFAASKEHTKSQLEQARFIDYVARDLRRSLAVKVDTYQNGPRISMTIPAYYDTTDGLLPDYPDPALPTPAPRIPTISKGYADYGTTPAVIRYFKTGTTLIRRVNGVDRPIATDVKDFELSFPPAKNDQVVNLTVTFVPTYRLSGNQEAARNGTQASASILLRNKRPKATVPDSP